VVLGHHCKGLPFEKVVMVRNRVRDWASVRVSLAFIKYGFVVA